jgi:hypothetical protein
MSPANAELLYINLEKQQKMCVLLVRSHILFSQAHVV